MLDLVTIKLGRKEYNLAELTNEYAVEDIVQQDGILNFIIEGVQFRAKGTQLSYQATKEGSLPKPKLLNSLKGFKELILNNKITVPLDSAKERDSHMKLVHEGFTVEKVPAVIEEFLKANGITTEVINFGDIDAATEKTPAKGAVAKELEKLDSQFIEFQDKQKAEKQAAAGAVKPEQAPADIEAKTQTSNLFPTDGDLDASQKAEEEQVANAKPKVEKSPEQREQEAIQRKLRREEDQRKEMEANKQISDIETKFQNIEFAAEAQEVLRDHLIINGSIPLYKTFVSNDPKLRPKYIDTVEPSQRSYDEDFKHNEGKRHGASIPLAESNAQYKIVWEESIPPQPKGYFMLVKEWLYFFDLNSLQFANHRRAIVQAGEKFGNSEATLVAKFIDKVTALRLLVMLDTNFKIYEIAINDYLKTSPTIYPKRINSARAKNITALRAMDHAKNSTKLSIRHFIPERTHVVGGVPEDIASLTKAYFHRSLFTPPANATRTKYDKLKQTYQEHFKKNAEGEWEYTQFTSPMVVPAYDSTKTSARTESLALPVVVPGENGTIPKFKTARADDKDSEYDPIYKPFLLFLADEFSKAKQSRTSSKKLDNAEDRRVQAQTLFSVFSGQTSSLT